ncbi:MAG TPA: SO2930 family diheme c-type cytochrome [Anaeromyxobacter sp.]|nr:SO2930 family diheme c-type cytochrome [Anaeromyxobacter sp.]
MRRLSGLAAAAVLAACGGGGGSPAAPPPPCQGPAAVAGLAALPAQLSALCVLEARQGAVVPLPGVVPYDLNTPLFSDYALKTRLLYVPPGVAVAYDAASALEPPVGTIVAKTFAFAPDLRAPDVGRTLVETRILARTAAGWLAGSYVWNGAQTDAVLAPGGEARSVTFVSPSGTTVTAAYRVPSVPLCSRCHADQADGQLHLIGPTARNLNRDLAYDSGAENQLAHWSRLGILTGAPAPDQAPRLPVWNDPSTGTVEQRARAWLEVNCAHCHSPTGLASNTGFYLGTAVTDPYQLGTCKPPVSAGPGAGSLLFDLVPGAPDRSILVHRISVDASDPAAIMPPVGRSVVEVEGVQLVRDWIAGMPAQTCP